MSTHVRSSLSNCPMLLIGRNIVNAGKRCVEKSYCLICLFLIHKAYRYLFYIGQTYANNGLMVTSKLHGKTKQQQQQQQQQQLQILGEKYLKSEVCVIHSALSFDRV